jgi:SAM-dependent methyltransferase
MDAFFKRFFPHDRGPVEGYHQALRGPLSRARKVLDCGGGPHTELAPSRSPGREVCFHPLGPDGSLPFPAEGLDVVCAGWVLEHVREPAAFLAEVRRVLRPGGSFVGLTVNAVHLAALAARAAHLLPPTLARRVVRRLYGRPAPEAFPVCFRLNTRAEVRRQARRAGLELTDVQGFANPDFFSFTPRLRQAAILVDYLLERAGTDLGRLYLVVTLRKPPVAAFAPAPPRAVAA